MAGGVTGAGSPVRSALILSHRPVPGCLGRRELVHALDPADRARPPRRRAPLCSRRPADGRVDPAARRRTGDGRFHGGRGRGSRPGDGQPGGALRAHGAHRVERPGRRSRAGDRDGHERHGGAGRRTVADGRSLGDRGARQWPVPIRRGAGSGRAGQQRIPGSRFRLAASAKAELLDMAAQLGPVSRRAPRYRSTSRRRPACLARQAAVMSIAVASSIDRWNAAVSSGPASSPGGSVCAGA